MSRLNLSLENLNYIVVHKISKLCNRLPEEHVNLSECISRLNNIVNDRSQIDLEFIKILTQTSVAFQVMLSAKTSQKVFDDNKNKIFIVDNYLDTAKIANRDLSYMTSMVDPNGLPIIDVTKIIYPCISCKIPIFRVGCDDQRCTNCCLNTTCAFHYQQINHLFPFDQGYVNAQMSRIFNLLFHDNEKIKIDEFFQKRS